MYPPTCQIFTFLSSGPFSICEVPIECYGYVTPHVPPSGTFGHFQEQHRSSEDWSIVGLREKGTVGAQSSPVFGFAWPG